MSTDSRISEAERLLRRDCKISFELGEGADACVATFKTSTLDGADVSIRIKKDVSPTHEAERQNHIEWLATVFGKVETLFEPTLED